MQNSWEFAAAAAFGLLWGSFLNVVIYRLPQIDAAATGARRGRTLAFLAWPLSFCPKCNAPIPPWRNIPVLSYVFLRGKAPCCDSRISPLYPLGEILGAAAIVWPLAHFGPGVDMLLAAIFLSFLLVASGIDMQRRWLMDELTLPLLWIGLVANIDARFALLPDAVLGAAGGYLGLWALGTVFTFFLQKRAMGNGDYKLLAALGAWVGWVDLVILVFLASSISLLPFAVRARKRKRQGKKISHYIGFGPYLSAAGALMLFYGDEIWLAYWGFFTWR